MLIKDTIKLYENKLTELGLSKEAIKRAHDVLIDFFTFLVDADVEVSAKDKRAVVEIKQETPVVATI